MWLGIIMFEEFNAFNLGLIFYFYSNEHDPIHVHVKKGDKETIFDLIIFNDVLTEIKIRKRRGKEMLLANDERITKDFILFYADDIVKKWMKYFILKSAVKRIRIKKKIDKEILKLKKINIK
ncbi:MAG: DUF4160 domain-containing protein [Flavobacteriaceae bacterium]|jgi:hypothetical protein|nr:DUF4160 domain-containing protein [Flavobacteriaceae bacterium]